MKIRLTEEQYKLIQEVIAQDEAFEKYIKEGYRLVVYVKGHSITFMVRKLENNSISMHTTKKFPIDLRGVMVAFSRDSYDDSNVLNLNKTHKIKDGADILSAPEEDWIALPIKDKKHPRYSIKGVQKIDILDNSGKVIETILNNKDFVDHGDEKGKGELSPKEKRKKADSEARKARRDSAEEDDNDIEVDLDMVKDMLNNDPILKKAFYHQPKLMNLIKIGNPVGISTTKKLINKYHDEKLGDSGKKLDNKKDEVVIIQFGSDVSFDEDGYLLELSSSKQYKTKVISNNKLKSSPYRGDFNFKLYLNEEIGIDEFKAVAVTEHTAKSGGFTKIKRDVTVRILQY